MNAVLPDEMLLEILRRLQPSDIINFLECVSIPENIINQPVFEDTHTVLECVMFLNCENVELIKKLIKNGAEPLKKSSCSTSPYLTLIVNNSLKFINDDKFNEIYDIFFPGELSFTRSGKCYTGVYRSN